MTGKLSAVHAALLLIIVAVSGYITWSTVSASSKLENLVVVAPVCAAVAVLVVVLSVNMLRHPAAEANTSGIWGDVLLLVVFAMFCFMLIRIGFDLATFVFVWVGVLMSGGKGIWQPPLFAAIFTVILVYTFGSLFPYPMPTLVL
ncbi:MAG: hypothetical protein DI616_17780 [Paracoccus denitrificans]|uniref:Tripartite tricarboxylate transporter TctB family protein n=1 Tax=Paracoccus denitrificans TaxID=266 RepID=A0A533I251_PARDE|nr:MAG: hypothetical protein DI616_17780 [Paracoccus denitrificans]